MPQLLKRPQAEEDLLDIWCYIALDNPDAADAKPASKSAWTKKL